MLRQAKVLGVFCNVTGSGFLILVIDSFIGDAATIKSKLLPGGIIFAFFAAVFLFLGIASFKLVMSKSREYKRLLEYNKPEIIKYEITDIKTYRRCTSYKIEFHINGHLCKESITSLHWTMNKNYKHRVRIIYNKNKQFKDFKVYM